MEELQGVNEGQKAEAEIRQQGIDPAYEAFRVSADCQYARKDADILKCNLDGMATCLKETNAPCATYPDLARCHFCGFSGEYGVEVVETGNLTVGIRDTTVTACKDTDACHERVCLSYANALGAALKAKGDD